MWNFLSSGCIQRSAVIYSISLHQSHTKTTREKCRLFFALPVKRYLKAHPFFFWKRGILVQCVVQCKEWISRRIQKEEKKLNIWVIHKLPHTQVIILHMLLYRTITPPNTWHQCQAFFSSNLHSREHHTMWGKKLDERKKTQDRISTRMHSTSIPPPTSAQDRAPLLARLR